jgi:hypothetical protein
LAADSPSAPLSGWAQVDGKEGKTWFFPLCGEQPKINELIFLVYFCGDYGRTSSAWGLSSVSAQLSG